MSELRKNENLEEEAQKPELCTNCHEFFGHKACEGMCSKCYRNSGKYNKADSNPLAQAISQATTLTNQIQEKITSATKAPVEEAKVDKAEIKDIVEAPKEEEPSNKQKDHTRCFQCNKKVGLLGFKCQCESTFCRNHRLPEAHICDFDFGKAGKERLAKENVQVKADKIERL